MGFAPHWPVHIGVFWCRHSDSAGQCQNAGPIPINGWEYYQAEEDIPWPSWTLAHPATRISNRCMPLWSADAFRLGRRLIVLETTGKRNFLLLQ